MKRNVKLLDDGIHNPLGVSNILQKGDNNLASGQSQGSKKGVDNVLSSKIGLGACAR